MTISALALSFAMVLSLISVSLGLHEASSERLRDSPRDMVITSLGLEPTIEDSHQAARELMRDTENFTGAMPLLTLIGRIGIPSGDEAVEFLPGEGVDIETGSFEVREMGMLGLVPDMARDFMEDDTLIVRSERLRMEGWFDVTDDPFYYTGDPEHFTSEVIMDRNVMDDAGLEDGDIVYFVDRRGEPSASLRVTGTVESSLIGSGLTQELVSGMALFHLSELQYLTGYDSVNTPSGKIYDLSSVIYLDIAEDRKDSEFRNDIVLMLEKEFPGLSVTYSESRLYRIEEEVMIFELFSAGVGVTTLFIGALFLSSIMLIDVEDRKAEISIMRAIGISRWRIYLQILKDSLLLSLIAGLAAVVPSYLGTFFLNRMLRSVYGVDIQFTVFSPVVVISGLLGMMVFVVIFSLIPGYRSTSIRILNGLSHYRNR